MSQRHVPVFFYGLFMDEELLRAKGAEPRNARAASLSGYALRIGERAALVPADDSIVHGIVMDLTHDDLDKLYAEASVSMYRPEPVVCKSGVRAIAALAYNLPAAPTGASNAAYAEKLRELARRLQLPAEYIDSIN